MRDSERARERDKEINRDQRSDDHAANESERESEREHDQRSDDHATNESERERERESAEERARDREKVRKRDKRGDDNAANEREREGEREGESEGERERQREMERERETKGARERGGETLLPVTPARALPVSFLPRDLSPLLSRHSRGDRRAGVSKSSGASSEHASVDIRLPVQDVDIRLPAVRYRTRVL